MPVFNSACWRYTVASQLPIQDFKLPHRQIELRGVRVHNLKEIDIDIPHGQLLSICGVSGSGKSSLAFDTLYAEGQRRYFESLSPYTRQFLEQLDKPDADRLEGIPPAIAIKAQRGSVAAKNANQSVGSASEILPYLRLLFAKASSPTCPACELEITRFDAAGVADFTAQMSAGTKFQIAFELNTDDIFGDPIEDLKARGFRRFVCDRTVHSVDSAPQLPNKPIAVIVDRLVAGSSSNERLLDSLATGFRSGGGSVVLFWKSDGPPDTKTEVVAIDQQEWSIRRFSDSLVCPKCHRVFEEPVPQTFDPTTRISTCTTCDGTGWQADEVGCESCGGSGLDDNALAFRIAGKNVHQYGLLELDQLNDCIAVIEQQASHRRDTTQLCRKIQERLQYLKKIGLSYLTLNRPVASLSSGELQRIALTKALGSTLTNMLYVLDEPSSGLHPVEVESLSQAIVGLKQRGNLVVVVDHNQELIAAGERIVELGPGAGVEGGSIVFDGTCDAMLQADNCVTGQFLAVRAGLRNPDRPRRKVSKKLRLDGATGNNLNDIAVEFPLRSYCAVTGLSGAGKSSLVEQTLFPAICNKYDSSASTGLPFRELTGADHCDEVVLVDHSPIGRSSRSNPVTYVKAFDDIRKSFAETVDAKLKNLTAGHFSFNVDGGRCEKCRGEGQLVIDMHFMTDMAIRCDQCQGTRFRDSVLDVRYRAQNIHEVLNMTVREAFVFFRGKTKVQTRLKALIDVGLDYIQLGQPSSTLSSGEAQRLKLAHYLNAPKSKRVLFLIDEPSFGLHPQDILKLVDCFDTLIADGHSLIVIEHNLQLIKHADWVIDLGPGASKNGGNVVASGTPEQIASCEESVTGRYLKDLFEREKLSLASLAEQESV